MGWYYTSNATRKDIIRELTQDANLKTLAHTVRGNVLWTVQETNNGNKFIACYLLSSPRLKGEAGYKPMDESMGPYYYSCPLPYLDMAPECNAEWRADVRKWHKRRSQKLAVGQTITLVPTCNPNKLLVTSLKPLRGKDGFGRTWSIPRRMLADTEETQNA